VVFAREQLKTCGVNPQCISFTNTTMESDKYVCHAGVGPLFDYESQRWFAVGGVMTRG